MENEYETYERNGLTVTIHYCDDINESPLDWETADERQGAVHYALKHNRYNLPYEIDADTGDFNSYSELAQAVTGKGGELEGYCHKFVRWYEHSGVSVSLRDDEGGHDWDAGIAGVIFGKTTEDIERSFEPWKAYTEGDIYGFTVTNPRNGDIVDSCCGYFGIDDVTDNANSEADNFKHPHDAAYAKHATIIHGGK